VVQGSRFRLSNAHECSPSCVSGRFGLTTKVRSRVATIRTDCWRSPVEAPRSSVRRRKYIREILPQKRFFELKVCSTTHNKPTIAASQAGIRQSRIDPRRLGTSRCLSSLALTSRQPSMTRRSHDQHAPPAASDATGFPAIVAAIRVRTTFITAPQQTYRIGGRGLTHSDARTATSLSSSCKSAIRRLQFGCRNPKLRARRNPFGSTR